MTALTELVLPKPSELVAPHCDATLITAILHQQTGR